MIRRLVAQIAWWWYPSYSAPDVPVVLKLKPPFPYRDAGPASVDAPEVYLPIKIKNGYAMSGAQWPSYRAPIAGEMEQGPNHNPDTMLGVDYAAY